MANSRKKVLLRTLRGDIHAGYLPSSGLLDPQGALALLDLEARLLALDLATVRWVAYVRDFNLGDRTDPERLSRRTFLARPRAEGLWVRLTMAGGEVVEGLAPLDLSLLDGALEDRGIFLTPPDIRSNTQRLFVPRTAFTALQVLAVITTPSRSRTTVKTPAPPRTDQNRLFP